MKDILDAIIALTLRNRYTGVLALSVGLSVMLAHGYGQTVFAPLTALEALESKVDRVLIRIEYHFTESRLADVENQLFELERILAAGNPRDSDIGRYNSLQIARNALKRHLDRLDL